MFLINTKILIVKQMTMMPVHGTTLKKKRKKKSKFLGSMQENGYVLYVMYLVSISYNIWNIMQDAKIERKEKENQL